MNLKILEKDRKMRENFQIGKDIDLEYVKERKEKLLRFREEIKLLKK